MGYAGTISIIFAACSLTGGCLAAAEDGDESSCAKCDDDQTPAHALELGDLVACQLVPIGDASSASARVDCSFPPLPENSSATVTRGFAKVVYRNGDASRLAVVEETDVDGEPRTVASYQVLVEEDLYPLEIQTAVEVAIRPPGASFSRTLYASDRTIVEAPPAEGSEVHAQGAPFDLWPIVFWPSDELVASWEQGETFLLIERVTYVFDVETAPLDGLVVGDVPTTLEFRMSHGRSNRDLPDLRAARQEVIHVPVPKTGPTGSGPALEAITDHTEGESSTPVTGPGTYDIQLDGTIVLREAD